MLIKTELSQNNREIMNNTIVLPMYLRITVIERVIYYQLSALESVTFPIEN